MMASLSAKPGRRSTVTRQTPSCPRDRFWVKQFLGAQCGWWWKNIQLQKKLHLRRSQGQRSSKKRRASSSGLANWVFCSSLAGKKTLLVTTSKSVNYSEHNESFTTFCANGSTIESHRRCQDPTFVQKEPWGKWNWHIEMEWCGLLLKKNVVQDRVQDWSILDACDAMARVKYKSHGIPGSTYPARQILCALICFGSGDIARGCGSSWFVGWRCACTVWCLQGQ